MTQKPFFGTTRTFLGNRHAIIAPDSHVMSSLPGVTGATSVVLISPEMGAGFTELTITFTDAGRSEFPDSQIEAFVYVLHGSVTGRAKNDEQILSAGEFMFIPAVTPWSLTQPEPGTQVHVFLKKYLALPGFPQPRVLFCRETDITGH